MLARLDGIPVTRSASSLWVGAAAARSAVAAREGSRLRRRTRSASAMARGADRVTPLPITLDSAAPPPATNALARLHERDLADGFGAVALPDALAPKFPRAAHAWPWQWVFPATTRYREQATGIERRHHLHETAVQRAVTRAVRRVGAREAGELPHVAPQLRDPSARDAATTSAPCRNCSATASVTHHHDLHPRPESRRPRGAQSARRIGHWIRLAPDAECRPNEPPRARVRGRLSEPGAAGRQRPVPHSPRAGDSACRKRQATCVRYPRPP